MAVRPRAQRRIDVLRESGLLTRALIVGAILLMGAVTVYATISTERTYHIAASTWGGQLTFRGERNNWLFSEASVCVAREDPDVRGRAEQAADEGETGEETPCPAALFEPKRRLSREVIRWTDGTVIHFQRSYEGALTIRTVNDKTKGLRAGSKVIVPADVWPGHGALTFTGEVRFGGDMGTGARDYLVSGQWEVRQIGAGTALFRDITEVVQSGALSRGASVRVVSEGAETTSVTSYGHITPAAEEQPGLELVALSEHGALALEVQYVGLPNPTVFRPDWIDAVSSSPILVAVAVLLTLLLTVVELVIAILAAGAKRTEEEGG